MGVVVSPSGWGGGIGGGACACRHAMLILGRGRNWWYRLSGVAVVCRWSVSGAAGVKPNAALWRSVHGMGVVVVTSGWGSGDGGGA
jgi:hypothetical protein